MIIFPKKSWRAAIPLVICLLSPQPTIAQSPDTIEGILEDLAKEKQAWKVKIEQATTPVAKKQAEACYTTCDIAYKRIDARPIRLQRALSYSRQCTACAPGERHSGAVPASKASDRKPTPEKNNTKLSSMPDVEGIYGGAMQGRIRVRADDRDDWFSICREMARVKDPGYKLARSIKPNTRLRIFGITYDPNAARGPRGNCNAAGGVILGPSR